MSKKFLGIAMIVAMFLLSSCSQISQVEVEDENVVNENVEVPESIKEINETNYSYNVDLSKEIDYIRKKAKEKQEYLKKLAEEEKQKEIDRKISENTYYIKKNSTSIFAEAELNEEIFKLNKKDSVYVEAKDDDTGIYSVKKDYYSEELGYINKENLNSNMSEFIRYTYDDVDYNHEIEFNNYNDNPRVEVKGIYVTMNTLVDSEKLDYLIKMANETEINAFVIDVKNDSGTIIFQSDAAKEYNERAYDRFFTKKLEPIMKKLKDNNVYTIARIVTFKSPQYAVNNPERAITYNGTNTVYKTRNGVAWASAYDRNLWDYNIKVSLEAIEYGFNEIQFDYVRFPALTRSVRKKLDFKNELDESRTLAIHNFLKEAYSKISEKNVYVSADIFGWAASSVTDEGIGQHWESLVTTIDYSCPMIYPSHYGTGIFGLKVPDANPYKTVYESTSDAIRRNGNVKNPAVLRPWIQDFTARWVSGYINYGATEVKAQIDALNDLGVKEYILWNPSNRYSWEALKK